MNDPNYLPSHKASKLTATFGKRIQYTVHGRNLKYYLEKGMRLDKIHSVIVFEESCYLKPFIDFCTQKRRESKTKLESDAWKKIINSLYGKFALLSEGKKLLGLAHCLYLSHSLFQASSLRTPMGEWKPDLILIPALL